MADSNVFASLTQKAEEKPQEFSWTAPDGGKFTASTADGLAASMAGYYAAQGGGKKEVTNPYPAPQAAQKAASETPKSTWKPPNVTSEAWVEMMAKNPVEAYNLVDQARYGMEDPIGYIKGLEEKIQALYNLNVQNTAQVWKENKKIDDFGSVSPHLEAILRERNAPVTYETLNWAHTEAKNRGLIKEAVKASEQAAAQVEAKVAPTAPPLLPQKSQPAATGPASGFLSELEKALDNPDASMEAIEKAAVNAGLFNPGSAALFES